MDEFGDHMLGCKSSLPTRTRLWHGPLVEVWLMLARMAGLSCGKEVRNLMLHSGKRPDVAILGALRNIIKDVRTVVGADPTEEAGIRKWPLAEGRQRMLNGIYAGGWPSNTGLDYLSSSRALTRAFKCRGGRAPSIIMPRKS